MKKLNSEKDFRATGNIKYFKSCSDYRTGFLMDVFINTDNTAIKRFNEYKGFVEYGNSGGEWDKYENIKNPSFSKF